MISTVASSSSIEVDSCVLAPLNAQILDGTPCFDTIFSILAMRIGAFTTLITGLGGPLSGSVALMLLLALLLNAALGQLDALLSQHFP